VVLHLNLNILVLEEIVEAWTQTKGNHSKATFFFLSEFGMKEYIEIGQFSDLPQAGSLRHVILFTPYLKLTAKMRLKYR
jgi:hypothetical protein